MIAAAGWLAATVFTSPAQPYYIAGSAMTPAWTPGAAANELTGSPLSLTTATTVGTYHEFKVSGATWADPNWPGNNVMIKGDANGTNTFYFYPGTISDGWSPPANRVGYADPGGMAWEVTGDFTSPAWGSDPNAQMTLDASAVGVYTNIYIVATAGTYNFKFRTPNTWSEVNFGADFGNGGGNAVFTTTTPNQAVLFKLDLPNGRWQAGGPPIYCDVQFSVDMTYEAANNPGFDPTSVTVNGDAINAWGGTACTNDPTAVNTNIYTSPFFSIAVGTSIQYQFRCLVDGITQYDALGGIGGNNRTMVVGNVGSTNVGPVFWNDASPDDYLNVDTFVTFSVTMTNAQQYPSGPAFIPGTDGLFMNGDFAGWPAWNPISLASYEFGIVPGTLVYTNAQTFLAGKPRSVTYKYAINGTDNEAAVYQNHRRFIRSTSGVYNMPLDTFGYQYVEPKTGGLTIGSPSAGKVPLSWLGYPGYTLSLQSSPDLANWTTVPDTSSITSTNWPIGSSPQFFRIIQTAP